VLVRHGSKDYPVRAFVHGHIFLLPLCFLSGISQTLVNSPIHSGTKANIPFFCLRKHCFHSQQEPNINRPRYSNMPPNNRAHERDVFIYDSNYRDTLLGGLWIAEGTTNANLYCMVDIICIFTDTFDIRDNNQQLVEKDEKPLQLGNYFIVSNGMSLLRFLRFL